MGDYTSELKWSPNYDIIVTENTKDKSFKQLSGGEQMASALAVRLALLKILSSTDIVFLDEPTQNMDELRRAHLSQQIQILKLKMNTKVLYTLFPLHCYMTNWQHRCKGTVDRFPVPINGIKE